MLYKSFRLLLPVVFASFCVFIGASAQETDLYTVENIAVDVTAADAIKARAQAFDEATATAFKELSERMLSETDAEGFTPPPPEKVSRLVKSFEITKEKLTSTRYAGTYTFHFDSNGVRQLFTKESKEFVATQSPPVLILPFIKRGLAATLWNADNPWMHAWARTNNQNALVPTITPLGDLDDVSDISGTQINALNTSGLDKMLTRYKATDALIAEASLDDTLIQTNGSSEPLAGLMTVSLYRINNGTPTKFETFSLSPDSGSDLATLMDQAVKRTQTLLKKDWRNQAAVKIPKAGDGKITVQIPLQSLGDWTDIQARLQRSAAVTKTQVVSMSPRAVIVQLEYFGQLERLAFDLQQQGLVLQRQAPAASRWDEIDVAPKVYVLMKQAMYDAIPRRRYSQTF